MTIQPADREGCGGETFAIYTYFFHLSIVLLLERNSSMDSQCLGYQFLLTNHPKTQWFKVILYFFLTVLQSALGSDEMSLCWSCWCHSCWSAAWLRHWGGWPLSLHMVLGSLLLHVISPRGLASRVAGPLTAQSSQEYKAVVTRPSYSVNPGLSQHHFCCPLG